MLASANWQASKRASKQAIEGEQENPVLVLTIEGDSDWYSDMVLSAESRRLPQPTSDR